MTSTYWDLANCHEVVDLGDALMSDVDNICDTRNGRHGESRKHGRGVCSRPSVQKATTGRRWQLSVMRKEETGSERCNNSHTISMT